MRVKVPLRVMAVVAVVALTASACGDVGSVLGRADDGWTSVAEAPIPARHDAAGVWTGTEVLVAGGTTVRPCPPGTDCAEPDGGERADGAAYDPASDSWRTIAPAPEAFVSTQAVWSGEEMVVVTATSALAYDPAADTWRVLDPPPEPRYEPAPPVVTDQGIVLVSYDQLPRRGRSDVVLDPTTGSWTTLPRDPFGESYDRSMAWDGQRLWLLSMAVEGHFEAYDGSSSRLAVLEGGLAAGEWRVVDPQTPEMVQGQVLWWADDRLVVPAGRYGGGAVRTLDTGAEEWADATAPEGDPERGCVVPRVGPGSAWTADGDELTALRGDRTVAVPDCSALPDPDVAVWAGDDLLLWGGPNPAFDGNTAGGLLWSPPAGE
jgi:hypothetical protein